MLMGCYERILMIVLFILELSKLESASKSLYLCWRDTKHILKELRFLCSSEYVKSRREKKILGRFDLFTHKQDTSPAHKRLLWRGKKQIEG